MNWSLVPVLVSKSPRVSTLDSIPFPGITICNLNQVLASKVQHFERGSMADSIVKTYCGKGKEFNPEIDFNGTYNNWQLYNEFIRNVSIFILYLII